MEQLAELCELGREALAAGEWGKAEQILAKAEPASVEALELRAESVWWQRRPIEAVAAWSEAAELSHGAGQVDDAVRLATWVAREYQALGSPSVASGWLARAEAWSTASDIGPHAQEWLTFVQASRNSGIAHTAQNLSSAADLDLMVLTQAAAGLDLIRAGQISEGLEYFDTALATATGSRLARLRTLGELCCDFVLATELTGDVERFAEWSQVVTEFVERRGYPPVMGFCTTCCAEVEERRGDWEAVEQQLRAAVVGLHDEGHAARCLPPDAKLARLLILQGRFEEAEFLATSGFGDGCTLALAHLAFERGDLSTTVTLTERVEHSLTKEPIEAIDARALQATALAQQGRHAEATDCLERLDQLTRTAGARAQALTALTRGRVAHAASDIEGTRNALEVAINHVSGVRGSIEGAEAHLLLAQVHAGDPDLAVAEAKAALRSFQAVNATHRANAAASVLRDLGDRSRVGTKEPSALLTSREQEVLRLVSSGLTNAEIAKRLVISNKTAGNHVSNVLMKLGVRSRTEAATYFVAQSD